jgi:hypothetical protein
VFFRVSFRNNRWGDIKRTENQQIVSPYIHTYMLCINHRHDRKRKTQKKCIALPKRPDNWNTNHEMWLNTDDIDNVLSRYPIIYPSFFYGGCLPRNFYQVYDADGYCLYGDVCTLSPEDIFRGGKRHIGFVFNLDAHGESGSHWVAMMVDVTRGHIYYYDSTANKPHDDIVKFMQYIQTRLNRAGIPLPIEMNQTVRQMENNECGIFAVAFLVLLLEKPDMTFHDITEYMGNDKDMNILRHVFYA